MHGSIPDVLIKVRARNSPKPSILCTEGTAMLLYAMYTFSMSNYRKVKPGKLLSSSTVDGLSVVGRSDRNNTPNT